MTRYETEIEGDDGWSRWIKPVMAGYKLACCDCGLVHEIDFRVIEEVEPYVLFRARRNNRSTGQRRRHSKVSG